MIVRGHVNLDVGWGLKGGKLELWGFNNLLFQRARGSLVLFYMYSVGDYLLCLCSLEVI